MAEAAETLFWLAATILLWQGCRILVARLTVSSFQNPLLFGIFGLCVLLPLAGVSAADYLRHVRPLTFLVGPATVALALPLWQQCALIVANARSMIFASLASTVTGMATATVIGKVIGLDAGHLASLGPKMTTLAVALPLSRLTGGYDNLVMLCVMGNGIGGALISTAVWERLMPQSSPAARAFSLGLTSHAMGIARTLTLTPEFVSFASCGMLLSALVTTVLYGIALGLGLA